MHSGSGATKANKLFKIMGLHGMTERTYKLHERIVGPIIEAVAKETCVDAVALEKSLTLENIEELKKSL